MAERQDMKERDGIEWKEWTVLLGNSFHYGIEET